MPGGRTADEIVNWLNKKTGPPAKALTTVEEAKEFVEKAASVAVIGFFKVGFLLIEQTYPSAGSKMFTC